MELKLTNCEFSTQIDVEDLNRILEHTECWSARFEGRKVIGVTGESKLLGKPIQLSRLVLNYHGKLDVDHIDRNPLNNKKDNLRVATRSQNLCNTIKTKGAKSKYKGVFKYSNYTRPKPWNVQVSANKKRYFGGYFRTEEEAALKANELMMKYQGEFARLNTIIPVN